ncbi:DUF6777 domain-containing protein [Embleya scabrispora]|uniref:DUF6777 domain-containing protein n=1 Tax=Embleya scabrispora TaxID=159449 RepID=UPI0003A48ADF|nr:DUF6777 domain-containing protein [Embleya scabrispora]MYS82616.1 hypothetical protein [Streptomyces sp. SID5474]
MSKVLGVVAGDPGADPFFSVNFGLDTLGLRPKVSAANLSGDTPGLFGGTNKARICDKEQLIRFLGLAANLVPATRWMKVLKIAGTPAIRAFVARLTPVVLRTDTLVRNHTLKNGALVAFDAILQAGTAVLIDEHGQPVVKCNCGNPLAEPEKDPGRVRLDTTDAGWKRTGSKPTAVKKAKQPVKTFVITDPIRPDLAVARPPGSAGDRDAPTATPPPLPERGKKATPTGSTGTAAVTGPTGSASSTSNSKSTSTSTGSRRPTTPGGAGGKSAEPGSPAAASIAPALR